MQNFKNKEVKIQITREEWIAHIQEQSKSSLTISNYCKEKNLSHRHFYDWKHRIYKKKKSAFIPTIIKSEPQPPMPAEKAMPSQRLCSIEFGKTARFIIESPEALLHMMNIIERKL